MLQKYKRSRKNTTWLFKGDREALMGTLCLARVNTSLFNTQYEAQGIWDKFSNWERQRAKHGWNTESKMVVGNFGCYNFEDMTSALCVNCPLLFSVMMMLFWFWCGKCFFVDCKDCAINMALMINLKIAIQEVRPGIYWVFMARFWWQKGFSSGLYEKLQEACLVSHKTSTQLAPRWTHLWQSSNGDSALQIT